jgi:hypothetical protein
MFSVSSTPNCENYKSCVQIWRGLPTSTNVKYKSYCSFWELYLHLQMNIQNEQLTLWHFQVNVEIFNNRLHFTTLSTCTNDNYTSRVQILPVSCKSTNKSYKTTLQFYSILFTSTNKIYQSTQFNNYFSLCQSQLQFNQHLATSTTELQCTFCQFYLHLLIRIINLECTFSQFRVNLPMRVIKLHCIFIQFCLYLTIRMITITTICNSFTPCANHIYKCTVHTFSLVSTHTNDIYKSTLHILPVSTNENYKCTVHI